MEMFRHIVQQYKVYMSVYRNFHLSKLFMKSPDVHEDVFKILTKSEPQCSYKIVLIKKRVYAYFKLSHDKIGIT